MNRDGVKLCMHEEFTLLWLNRYWSAKRFSIAALEKIYHKLLEIDEAAKTSQVTLDLALETLMVELTA